MSKVIIFSRTFPAYHPKAGQPTYFVEKLRESLVNPEAEDAKHHTIRKGNRFKVGDKFSPRIWEGKPYRSKQITVAPDVEVKKEWKIKINEQGSIFIDGRHYPYFGNVCKNDGLSGEDFLDWFQIQYDSCNNEPFEGQIICWTDSVNY